MKAITPTSPLEAAVQRRELLRFAIASTLLGVPRINRAGAAVPAPPSIVQPTSPTGDGVIGAYGEVRVADLGGTAVPVLVTAAGNLAVMNLTGRAAYIRFGSDTTAITLTSAGIRFGAMGSLLAWSPAAFAQLITAIARDAQKARGAARLRSAMLMAYPEAVMRLKTSPNRSVMSLMARSAAGVGALSISRCSTTTITETVYDTVTRVVQVWKSAESQYQECYDREIARSPCRDTLFAKSACAAAICAARGFIDMLVATYEIVEQVAREVVRTVVICARPLVGQWPDPLDVLRTVPGKYSLAQPRAAFSAADIGAATALLAAIFQVLGAGQTRLGQFSDCLLRGRWSLAALDTRIDFGDGTMVMPYGVKVCLTRACATQFSATQIAAELASSWSALLSVLVALSPEYAAFVMALGIAITPPSALGLGPLLAGAAPLVTACAAVVVAFIILALIYGTAIIGQMTVWQAAGLLDSNGDGYVCIEHPTFALALIKAALLGAAPAELVPPIVNPA